MERVETMRPFIEEALSCCEPMSLKEVPWSQAGLVFFELRRGLGGGAAES
jgi:hypothetical protein